MLFDQKPIRWITIIPLKLYVFSVWYIRNYLFQKTVSHFSLEIENIDSYEQSKLIFLLYINYPIVELELELLEFKDYQLVLKNPHITKLEVSFMMSTCIFLLLKNMQFKNLENLKLENIIISNDKPIKFNSYPHLKSLVFKNCVYQESEDFTSLDISSNQLEIFTLYEHDNYVTKKNLFSALKKQSLLNSLSLTIHHDDFKKILDLIECLDNLSSINLRFNQALSADETLLLLVKLQKKTSIQEINLNHISITTENFSILNALVLMNLKLKSLSLVKVNFANSAIFFDLLSLLLKESAISVFNLDSDSLSFTDLDNIQLLDCYEKIFKSNLNLKIFRIILNESSLFEYPDFNSALKIIIKQHFNLLALKYYPIHDISNEVLVRNLHLYHRYFGTLEKSWVDCDYHLLTDTLLKLEDELIREGHLEIIEPIFQYYFFRHLPFHPQCLGHWIGQNSFNSNALKLNLALELFSFDGTQEQTRYIKIFLIKFLKPLYQDYELAQQIVHRCYMNIVEGNDGVYLSNASFDEIYAMPQYPSLESLSNPFVLEDKTSISKLPLNKHERLATLHPLDLYIGMMIYSCVVFANTFFMFYMLNQIKNLIVSEIEDGLSPLPRP